MRGDFVAIITGATTLIIGVFVVSMLFGTMPANEFHDVTNETVTINTSSSTQVAEEYGTNYYDNETVYSGGVQLTEGTDYEWFPENQSIVWYNTTDVTDGSDASVTYYFDAKPKMARNSVGTIGQAFTLGAVAVIVLVAALILGLIANFGGGGGRGGMMGGGRRR